MIDITKVMNGALTERVGIEIQKVLSNISDVNTSPTARRRIILHITFKGDDMRETADITFLTKTQLAPARSLNTRIAFERNDTGGITAEEMHRGSTRGQVTISDSGEIQEPQTVSKIYNIAGGKG